MKKFILILFASLLLVGGCGQDNANQEKTSESVLIFAITESDLLDMDVTQTQINTWKIANPDWHNLFGSGTQRDKSIPGSLDDLPDPPVILVLPNK